MADLEGIKPGDRFFLADDHGVICYRGTLRDDGTALVDVISRRGVDPVVLTAQELFDTYDPEIYELGTIGTAV